MIINVSFYLILLMFLMKKRLPGHGPKELSGRLGLCDVRQLHGRSLRWNQVGFVTPTSALLHHQN